MPAVRGGSAAVRGSPRCPKGSRCSLLGELAAGDARLVWRGSSVALAGPRTTRCSRTRRSSSSTSRRPGSLRRTAGSARSARCASQGLELVGDVRDARRPRRAAARADRAADRASATRSCGGRRRSRRALRRFLGLRGRRRCSSRTTPASTGASSIASSSGCTGKRLSAPAIDTVAARAAPARRARGGASSLASLAFFFGVSVGSRAIARCPMRRRPPRSSCTCSASRRSAARRRSPSCSALAAPRQRRVHGKRSLAHGAPDTAGRLPLPRPARPGALRRQGPRPARPPPLVLPERAAAPVGRGGARSRSSGSSGACSAPSSRRRSRSCG